MRSVIDGVEPFADQARRSVLAWRFQPAHRGSTPVAARINARVAFHQEQVPSPPRTTGQPPPTTQGAAATTPASATSNVVIEVPQDVEVHGARHEIGETTLSATDVREMPGAFGDPFRAIEALPGVIPVVSGLPYFYIRGAPPTNNGLPGRRHPRPLSSRRHRGRGSSIRRSSIASTSIRAQSCGVGPRGGRRDRRSDARPCNDAPRRSQPTPHRLGSSA